MKKLSTVLIYAGLFLFFLCLVFFAALFYPVISKEIGYRFGKHSSDANVEATGVDGVLNSYIVAADPDFSVVIPKIGANSKVIKDVDSNNSYDYQVALTKGVAHAKGTSYPDQNGNVFLFAHSSANFTDASRYNSVFYLLNKMETGDKFYIVYLGKVYKYEASKVSIVSPQQSEYLKGSSEGQTATLMTCWPAGTALKRLVVIGKLQDVK